MLTSASYRFVVMKPLIPTDLHLPVTYGRIAFLDGEGYDKEKPYTIAGPLPHDQEPIRTNLRCSPREVPIRDLRGFESHLSIEKTGFEIVNLPAKADLDTVNEKSVEEYLLQITGWVEQRLNAHHVVCYAYKVKSPSQPFLILRIEHADFEVTVSK